MLHGAYFPVKSCINERFFSKLALTSVSDKILIYALTTRHNVIQNPYLDYKRKLILIFFPFLILHSRNIWRKVCFITWLIWFGTNPTDYTTHNAGYNGKRFFS